MPVRRPLRAYVIDGTNRDAGKNAGGGFHGPAVSQPRLRIAAVQDESRLIWGDANAVVWSGFADRAKTRAIAFVPRELNVARGCVEIDQYTVMRSGKQGTGGTTQLAGDILCGHRNGFASKLEIRNVKRLGQ